MTIDAADTFLLGGDLPVNRVGLGAMRLSSTGFTGPARDPEAGKAVLRRALNLGVNHIDTATFYRSHDGTVTANGLIREALAPHPDDLVIATKVGPWEHPDGRVEQTDDPTALRPAIEANLAGLGLDRLDLVYLRVGQMEPPHGQSTYRRPVPGPRTTARGRADPTSRAQQRRHRPPR
nr:aldo/keto reductase [Gordonia sp. LAM0048]